MGPRLTVRLGGALLVVLAALLVAAAGVAAPKKAAPRQRKVAALAPARHLTVAGRDKLRSRWAASLPAVRVKNRNTGAVATLRLYDEDGSVDREAMRAFMRVACTEKDAPDVDGEVKEPLDLRLVQLAFRASYHFGGKPIVVVSATRKGAHGKHGTGEALDFQLDGVKASLLASHLRGVGRAGVGIYTHPKTQYVHLDVRDMSFHWVDGSPPGVTWKERRMADPRREKRDAGWVAAKDLPESAYAL